MHSTQPGPEGLTSLIWSRWRHDLAIEQDSDEIPKPAAPLARASLIYVAGQKRVRDVAVAIVYDVDQRLTADDDHVDSPSATGRLAPAESIHGTAASANTTPAPAAARNGIATPSANRAPPTSDPTAVAVLSAVPTMP